MLLFPRKKQQQTNKRQQQRKILGGKAIRLTRLAARWGVGQRSCLLCNE